MRLRGRATPQMNSKGNFTAEVELMRSAKPTARELQSAKAAVESRIMLSLEGIGGFGGISDRINKYNHHLKNPGYLIQDIQRVSRVSADDVQQFATKYLTRNARVVIHRSRRA